MRLCEKRLVQRAQPNAGHTVALLSTRSICLAEEEEEEEEEEEGEERTTCVLWQKIRNETSPEV